MQILRVYSAYCYVQFYPEVFCILVMQMTTMFRASR